MTFNNNRHNNNWYDQPPPPPVVIPMGNQGNQQSEAMDGYLRAQTRATTQWSDRQNRMWKYAPYFAIGFVIVIILSVVLYFIVAKSMKSDFDKNTNKIFEKFENSRNEMQENFEKNFR